MKKRLTPVLLFVALLISTSCSEKKQTKTILLLASQKHFGLFAGEILRTEGFNHFTLDSITNINANYLQQFGIVIITKSDLTNEQTDMLTSYVEEGGNLIAFSPDKKLQHILGIKATNDNNPTRYITITDDADIGKGLLKEKLIIHAAGEAYTLEGAKAIALYNTPDGAATNSPAVTLNTFGKGQSLAFTYNLPQSIVYTRQGNPESAGMEKDGILGIRAMDLFTHGFVDSTQNLLNPADEQIRILTHAIEHMSSKPLPKLWYFPDSLKSVVTLNNDGEDSKEPEFIKQFQDVAAHGASMTLYVKEPQYISPDRIAAWVKDGFEISGHPDDTRQAKLPDWKTMDSVYRDLNARLNTMYGLPPMKTVTNHWFVWVGNNADGSQNFAAQAEIESQHGVQLDCNYAHYDNQSDQGHFLGKMGTLQGNYTGTGLTMKFANNKGNILDIYQQLNNVYDQQYMEHRDHDGYYSAFQGLLDRSLNNEIYSSISIRAHNNEYWFSEVPLMKMLDYAKTNSIPVWTELKWLEFLQAKDATTFEDVQWKDDELSFTIKSPVKFERALSCLVPYRHGELKVSSVLVDGKETKFSVVMVKGVEYVRVGVEAGTDHKIQIGFRPH